MIMIGDYIRLTDCEEIYTSPTIGLYRTKSGHQYVYVHMEDGIPEVDIMDCSNSVEIINRLHPLGLYDHMMENFQDQIQIL